MKSPYQNSVKKLDEVFQRYIRLRDESKLCCSCGRWAEKKDAGHFINRRWMATRWREDNCHGQCMACNRFDEGNAAGYALFMIKRYGEAHIEILRGLSRESAHFTIPEIGLLIQDYKKKIKVLQSKQEV